MNSCPMRGGNPAGSVFPFGTRWSGQLYEYRGCAACGTSFVAPLPSAKELAAMYSQQSYHDIFYTAEDEEQPPTYLAEVQQYLTPGGDLLDFGCGNGDFLTTARAAGFRAVGVELDEGARSTAAEASRCEVLALAEVVAQGRRFDVIHLGDVLEHLPAPAEMLRQLEALLRPSGSFFLEGPIENNASLVHIAARVFGSAKKALGRNLYADQPPFHLFRTTARAQREFLERVMDYRVSAFIVAETGWPYWLPSDRLLRPRSPGHAVKMVIGMAAIGLASLGRLVGASAGNRFGAIATPVTPVEQAPAA